MRWSQILITFNDSWLPPLAYFALLPYLTKLTSAGSRDPVTSLILHHSPDWLSPAGPFVPMVGWTDSTERVQ